MQCAWEGGAPNANNMQFSGACTRRSARVREVLQAQPRSPADQQVTIRTSDVHGFGAFAVTPIPAHTTLGRIQGTVLRPAQVQPAQRGYIWQPSQQKCIDMRAKNGNWLQFVNDAHNTRSKTNCRFTSVGTLRTKRAIRAGEELLVSYGRSFWAGKR